MMHRLTALAACLCMTLWGGVPAAAQTGGPVVVELFTSQGCSSCPPADALLTKLAGRDDVIALALHVDYWDYIGWADTFAQPKFTKRQKGYAHAAGSRMVYTPQMVIGGETHVVGTRPMEVMEALMAHAKRVYPVSLTVWAEGQSLRLSAPAPDAAVAGEMVLHVVWTTPEAVVDVRRGENAGRRLSYSNVVTRWETAGTWDGRAPLDRTLPLGAEGVPAAVLVQAGPVGAILGAARPD